MGEAKRRGTYEQRKAQAIERKKQLEKDRFEKDMIYKYESKDITQKQKRKAMILTHIFGHVLGGRR